MRKNYVVDANILLHDPQSIFNFADNTVIIPIGVIAEIDRFKKEMTDRGFNARRVARLLDGLRDQDSLIQGVKLPSGGSLKIHCNGDLYADFQPDGDLAVLRTAKAMQESEPDTPTVIVTKDINLRIRADALGVPAEDYETDHVSLEHLDSGDVDWVVSDAELARFREQGELAVEGKPRLANEYLLLRSETSERKTLLCRSDTEGRRLLALKVPETGVCGVKPRNKAQHFAIDALLDDDIKLVTLMGKAGTGKTLLAMAAALHCALKTRRYRGVVAARPVIPLGRDMGYLPGDIESKLAPWMKPIVDTLNYLLELGGPIKRCDDAETLLSGGHVEIQPLAYIRGRSIAKQYVIIDEAQNLTPLEVKTVITRIGEDSKVVLTGDPHQIDNPYVDGNSNGFTYLTNRFRSRSISAHIALRKGERSALAELAANIL